MRKRTAASIVYDIKAGYRPQGSELTAADLGRPLSRLEGFGVVLPSDIGKKVWLKSFGLVIENNEQRATRQAKLISGTK